MKNLLAGSAVLSILLASGGPTAPEDPIPLTFRPLHRELSDRLDRFESFVQRLPTRASAGVTFAAELIPANGNRGEALLAPQAFQGTLLYLARLQELGVRGVTIQMPYPLLSPRFPRSDEYWAFYRKLAAEIGRRGVKLLVKSGPVFTDPEISPVRPDYSRLTWDDYFSARTAIAVRIGREIEPDYLTIGNEPSTEMMVLGKSGLTEVRYTRFVNDTLRRLRRKGTLIGAGAGNWDNPAFIESLARDTALDYIDLHIYPLAGRTTDYLRRAVDMAAVVRANRKRIVIGELWLYKAGARELTGTPTHVAMFGRDTFGFWSKYFFAYLPQHPGGSVHVHRIGVRRDHPRAIRRIVVRASAPVPTALHRCADVSIEGRRPCKRSGLDARHAILRRAGGVGSSSSRGPATGRAGVSLTGMAAYAPPVKSRPESWQSCEAAP